MCDIKCLKYAPCGELFPPSGFCFFTTITEPTHLFRSLYGKWLPHGGAIKSPLDDETMLLASNFYRDFYRGTSVVCKIHLKSGYLYEGRKEWSPPGPVWTLTMVCSAMVPPEAKRILLPHAQIIDLAYVKVSLNSDSLRAYAGYVCPCLWVWQCILIVNLHLPDSYHKGAIWHIVCLTSVSSTFSCVSFLLKKYI